MAEGQDFVDTDKIILSDRANATAAPKLNSDARVPECGMDVKKKQISSKSGNDIC